VEHSLRSWRDCVRSTEKSGEAAKGMGRSYTQARWNTKLVELAGESLNSVSGVKYFVMECSKGICYQSTRGSS